MKRRFDPTGGFVKGIIEENYIPAQSMKHQEQNPPVPANNLHQLKSLVELNVY
jgi:hypothetical protein